MGTFNQVTKDKLIRKVIVEVGENFIKLDNGVQIDITPSKIDHLNTVHAEGTPAEIAQRDAERAEVDNASIPENETE